MDVGGRPHRPHFLLLKGTQQLHLHLVRQVTHFVEEHRTALGLFEDAFLVGDGRCKRAFQVAKQLAGGKLLGQAAAVHGDERAFFVLAHVVYHAGDVLFTRATLTEDQDGEFGGSHQFHMFVETLHRRARAPHPLFVTRQEIARVLFLCRSQGGSNLFLEHAGIDGFLEIVECTEFHCGDSRLHLGIARHHDERHLALQLLPYMGHQDDTVAIRESQVSKDQVETAIGDLDLGLLIP